MNCDAPIDRTDTSHNQDVSLESTQRFRHCPHVKHIVRLALLGSVLLVSGTKSLAESLCLPAESTNNLPSDTFIRTVATAARQSKPLTAPDPMTARLARILLTGLRVAPAQVRVEIAPMHCPAVTNLVADARIEPGRFHTAFVVLGNRPLDDSTPTTDMIQRISTAIPNVAGRTNTALVLTGGPTEGLVSEARMMALMALARGVSRDQIILEEESWTTGRNAALTAPIIERLGVRTVFIVSKKSHLNFAMNEFRKYSVFRDAIPLESPEARAESIRQMEDYLKTHHSPGVESRLAALRADSHGVD